MKYVVMHGSVKMKSHDENGLVGLGGVVELSEKDARAMDPAGTMLMTEEQAHAHFEHAEALEKLVKAKAKAQAELDAKFKKEGVKEEQPLIEPGSGLHVKHANAAKLFMANKPAARAETKKEGTK